MKPKVSLTRHIGGCSNYESSVGFPKTTGYRIKSASIWVDLRIWVQFKGPFYKRDVLTIVGT